MQHTFRAICERLATDHTLLLVLHELDALCVQSLLQFRQVDVYMSAEPKSQIDSSLSLF